MSRFISNISQKIELSDGEFIEIRQSLPFSEMEPIMILLDKNNEMSSSIKMAIPLLKASITGWNLKDEAGVIVEFSKEKIDQLDTKTILEILPKLTEIYFPKKK